MKRLFLLNCFFAWILLSIHAQEKNYRDEYILQTIEVEVGDTLRAKEEAAKKSKLQHEQVLKANAFRQEIIIVIDSLINNKVKRIKDQKSQQIVRDAYEFNKSLHVSKEEEDAAMKGKMDVRAYKMLTDYKKYQKEQYLLYTKEVNVNWKDYITFHKETRSVKKKNPNYRPGYSDIDAEWQWLEEFTFENYEGILKHVITSFPKEENYYKSEKHPEFKIYQIDWKQWYACDKEDNLMGVGYFDGYVNRNNIIQAAMLYDYDNNAYNIKGEKQSVYRWSRYLIESGKYDIDADEYIEMLTLGMNSLGKSLDIGLKLKNITQAEYNRHMAKIRPAKAELKKKIELLKRIKPSTDDQDRAKKYVRQLLTDNEQKYGYNNAKFNHIRKNGTQFILQDKTESFQLLLTYSIDEKNQLKDNYKVINK